MDLGAMLQQAQQMQEQLLQTQAELADTRVEGSAGGGLVSATVTGTGELLDLIIAPEACDPDDTETLADLVVAAVRDATTSAQQLAVERLGPLSGALGDTGPGDALPGAPGGSPLGF
ncbi:MAG: YbaB/EbfC family nucleoid-associated protein [Nocardioidaceae bacterium]